MSCARKREVIMGDEHHNGSCSWEQEAIMGAVHWRRS